MPTSIHINDIGERVKIFIGINKERSEYKGTDIMLKAATRLQEQYPAKMELVKAESVPFKEYERLMDGSDAILDQLYSYAPSMNSLLAMSKGIVCIGGGEEECYELVNEKSLRPVVNVYPCYESVFGELKKLILTPSKLLGLKQQSIEYVRKHHDYIKVASEYAKYYAASIGR